MKINQLLLMIMLVVSLVISGCDFLKPTEIAELKKQSDSVRELESTTSRQQNDINSLQKRIDILNEQNKATDYTIEQCNAQLVSIIKDMNKIKSDIFLEQIKQNTYKTATFDPAAGEGFSRLDTSLGSFTVSIQEIKPHADGVKVRLHVGNITTAKVNGGTFKAKWGVRMPTYDNKEDWYSRYVNWQGSLKEKDIVFTEVLQPGTWNNVTLTLPGISPQQLGHMELSMETNQISLIQPR